MNNLSESRRLLVEDKIPHLSFINTFSFRDDTRIKTLYDATDVLGLWEYYYARPRVEGKPSVPEFCLWFIKFPAMPQADETNTLFRLSDVLNVLRILKLDFWEIFGENLNFRGCHHCWYSLLVTDTYDNDNIMGLRPVNQRQIDALGYLLKKRLDRVTFHDGELVVS